MTHQIKLISQYEHISALNGDDEDELIGNQQQM